MAEDFFTGDRRRKYCVKCQKIDLKADKCEPRCRQCKIPLRTRGVGLALSGGGYRAALFHLGGLWRLNELGWLKKLAEVTSVSGGSITAAWLGLQWKKLKFGKDGVAANFVEEIVNPLREFCTRNIQVEGFFCGLARPYRRKLFGKATLQDLPGDRKDPIFTIYATSLQTGVSVRLSRQHVADYKLGEVKKPDIELAQAVAASSAFPIAMAPVILHFKLSEWSDFKHKKEDKDKSEDISEEDRKKMRKDRDKMRQTMVLTDGGVYDNMGLERIFDRYSTVLISDAGAPFSINTGTFWSGMNRLGILIRSNSIITEQTRRLRKRWSIADFEDKKARGTYWGIDTDIKGYEPTEEEEKKKFLPPLLEDSEETEKLSDIATCLKDLGEKNQQALINWSYALADAGLRRWVLDEGAKPGHLPYPE